MVFSPKTGHSSSQIVAMQQKRNPSIQIEAPKMTQKEEKSVPSDQIARDVGEGVMEPSKKRKVTDADDQAVEVHFQEEILTDILARLPVRSLLRFKCLSRFWGTLIDEPYFKMKHLNHSKNDQNSKKFLISQVLLEEGRFSMYCCPLSSVHLVEDVRKLECPLVSEPLDCKIYCCCDGLFVISVYDSIVKRYIFLLWNPSTGESIVLPTPKFRAEGSCFGLVYDSTSDDYKILKIDENGNNGRKAPGEILALKSGSWRKIDEHPRLIRSAVYGMHSLAFLHGAFHWIGISQNYSVVSFNISHEVYGEIPLPEQICLMTDIMSIGVSVLDGLICAYSNVDHQEKRSFKLWVMRDYGVKESWHQVFTIKNPDICLAAPKYRFADGEVLFWCLHSRRGESAFRTQRRSSVLWPQGAAQNGFAFTESLLSPKLLT